MAVKRSGIGTIAVAAFLAAACWGCSLSTEGTMYDIAVKAVKADPGFPAGATLGSIGKCKFFIGKSAASMEIPYSASGRNSFYVVRLNRIGTRWELDRCMPAPIPAPETAAPAGL